MSRFTMIRRIWLVSGIRQLILGNTDVELRAVLDKCEQFLLIPDRGADERAERVELEDWRRILISEIQRRQIEGWIR
jgi:hypothetical protein